jgi:S-DNA-T family DNA segregation ATPase FtsK/SpoIIIE
MSRKTPAGSGNGFNDVIGIVLMALAVLLLAALLSYDPHDVAANILPPNPSVRNWIGPFGAHLAFYSFLWVGAAAYVLPVLLLLIGLGCFFQSFAYLRRRWLWTVVLFLCCTGLLDLHRQHLPNLQKRLGILPGGILGDALNHDLFGYFGTVGATIIFLMLYFISLMFLTNFKLGEQFSAMQDSYISPTGSLRVSSTTRYCLSSVIIDRFLK